MTDVVELSVADSLTTARIAPSLGFNCFEFSVHQAGRLFRLIDAEDQFPIDSKPSGHGIPLLFPFPNRIKEGRFDWQGSLYELPLDRVPFNKQNAIHGFCLDRPWRVTKQSAHRVTAEFQLSLDAPDRREYWPADFVIECTYTVTDASLALEVLISNPDTVPLPWGFGTHAYFRIPLSAASQLSDCLFEAPVDSQWELEDCLPTGTSEPLSGSVGGLTDGVRLGDVRLDDAFRLRTGADSCVILDEGCGWQIRQSFSSQFTQMVIYTPPGRNAVCLEPYTCLTDAVNHPDLETGWKVLQPGEAERLQVTIRLEPVVA